MYTSCVVRRNLRQKLWPDSVYSRLHSFSAYRPAKKEPVQPAAALSDQDVEVGGNIGGGDGRVHCASAPPRTPTEVERVVAVLLHQHLEAHDAVLRQVHVRAEGLHHQPVLCRSPGRSTCPAACPAAPRSGRQRRRRAARRRTRTRSPSPSPGSATPCTRRTAPTAPATPSTRSAPGPSLPFPAPTRISPQQPPICGFSSISLYSWISAVGMGYTSRINHPPTLVPTSSSVMNCGLNWRAKPRMIQRCEESLPMLCSFTANSTSNGV